MKTRYLPMAALFSALLFIVGCKSGPSYKSGFDFSQYHTFAIQPITAQGTYEDPALITRLQRPVTETVATTLTGKGFKQVAASEADFLVKPLFNFWQEQGRVEERRFNLEIIDVKTGQVVWSNFYYRTTDQSLPSDVVCQKVAEMLQPFPPGANQPSNNVK